MERAAARPPVQSARASPLALPGPALVLGRSQHALLPSLDAEPPSHRRARLPAAAPCWSGRGCSPLRWCCRRASRCCRKARWPTATAGWASCSWRRWRAHGVAAASVPREHDPEGAGRSSTGPASRAFRPGRWRSASASWSASRSAATAMACCWWRARCCAAVPWAAAVRDDGRPAGQACDLAAMTDRRRRSCSADRCRPTAFADSVAGLLGAALRSLTHRTATPCMPAQPLPNRCPHARARRSRPAAAARTGRDQQALSGQVVANDDVSLSVAAGEIHGLIGENGAGKSTLMKIAYGAVVPDAGEIRWNGETVAVASPAAARRLGIGMVFQHFALFDTLTVAQNVALVLPAAGRSGSVSPQRIRAIGRRYGLAIDPRSPRPRLVGRRAPAGGDHPRAAAGAAAADHGRADVGADAEGASTSCSGRCASWPPKACRSSTSATSCTRCARLCSKATVHACGQGDRASAIRRARPSPACPG